MSKNRKNLHSNMDRLKGEPIEAFNDIIKLGLQDVLYNTKTNNIYTPNTDKTSNLKGGEINNENRNKE